MSRRIYYDEHPALYVSGKFRMYEEWWNDVLEAECTDNWEQLNGYDQFIRKLRAEGRSNLQMPTLWPAIEGRVSQNLARLKSREPIVRLEAEDNANPYDVLKAMSIQEWIRHVLERQDWLLEIASMMMAAETFPIVWIKCRIGELPMTPAEQHELERIMGMYPGTMAGASRTVPEFELLPPSNVFYDYRSNGKGFIEKFHVKQCSLDEVYDMFGSNIVRRVEQFESQEPAWKREWEEAAGRRGWKQWGEPRYRLAEGWIKALHSDGTVRTKVVRFFPDVIESDSNTPAGMFIDDMEPPVGFDPFIPVVARRLPFHLLGKSTVGLGKAYQRESAVLANMALDILGYSAAPPILIQKGSVDNPNQLSFSSRAVWQLNDSTFPPQALHVPLPNAPFLDSMRAQMDADLNHVTAAYEGITGAPSGKSDETLGAYRQRTASGQGRVELSMLNYAQAVTGIVWRYWQYMREFPRNILGRTPLPTRTPIGPQMITRDFLDVAAKIRVPSLTEFEDEEIKKIEFDRFIERVIPFAVVAGNLQAQSEILSIYAEQHIQDADTLGRLRRSFLAPIDPMLLGGGGGPNNSGMPMTRFSPGTGDAERRVAAFGAAGAGGG